MYVTKLEGGVEMTIEEAIVLIIATILGAGILGGAIHAGLAKIADAMKKKR